MKPNNFYKMYYKCELDIKGLKITFRITSYNVCYTKLLRNDTIPYNDQMLSTITRTNIDIVRSAISIFKELELMEVLDDQTIYLTETTKMLGESTSTHRVQKYRETKKLIENDA